MREAFEKVTAAQLIWPTRADRGITGNREGPIASPRILTRVREISRLQTTMNDTGAASSSTDVSALPI